jgi:hypothetical protein
MHVNDIFRVEGGPTYQINYNYLNQKVKMWEKVLIAWD